MFDCDVIDGSGLIFIIVNDSYLKDFLAKKPSVIVCILTVDVL